MPSFGSRIEFAVKSQLFWISFCLFVCFFVRFFFVAFHSNIVIAVTVSLQRNSNSMVTFWKGNYTVLIVNWRLKQN